MSGLKYTCQCSNCYFTCRNPDEAVRPTFCEIVVSLQQPDFQVLKWSSDDEAKYSKEARTLGSSIEKGHDLYPELQGAYLTKGSADSLPMECGTTAITSEKIDDSSNLQIPDTSGYDALSKIKDLSTCEDVNPSKPAFVGEDGYHVLTKSDEVFIDM